MHGPLPHQLLLGAKPVKREQLLHWPGENGIPGEWALLAEEQYQQRNPAYKPGNHHFRQDSTLHELVLGVPEPVLELHALIYEPVLELHALIYWCSFQAPSIARPPTHEHLDNLSHSPTPSGFDPQAISVRNLQLTIAGLTESFLQAKACFADFVAKLVAVGLTDRCTPRQVCSCNCCWIVLRRTGAQSGSTDCLPHCLRLSLTAWLTASVAHCM